MNAPHAPLWGVQSDRQGTKARARSSSTPCCAGWQSRCPSRKMSRTMTRQRPENCPTRSKCSKTCSRPATWKTASTPSASGRNKGSGPTPPSKDALASGGQVGRFFSARYRPVAPFLIMSCRTPLRVTWHGVKYQFSSDVVGEGAISTPKLANFAY